MATRFYLSNLRIPTITPGYESSWETTTNALRRAMRLVQEGSTLGSVTYNVIPATVPLDALHRQFISEPLDSAGTLSGTFSYIFRTAQTTTASDAFVQVVVKIVQSDGTTVRGVAYSGHADTTVVATVGAQNQEMPTAAATRIGNAISLTSQAYQPGDYIVVEFGNRYVTTSGSNQGVALNHGDPGDGTADFALTSGLTTTLVSWLEFSQTLTFQDTGAIRFYLPASGTAAVTPASFAGIWDDTASATVRPMALTKSNTALATKAVTEATTTNAFDVLNVQFVSDETMPGARTIGTGTMSAVMRNLESSTNANNIMQIAVRVLSNDGSTVRGTLYAGQSATAATGTAGAQDQEAPTSVATRIWSAIALSSVSAQTGDRIVVEIGVRACNTSATSFTHTQTFGDPTATNDFGLMQDYATNLVPWIEFSEDFFATTVGTATLDGSGTLSTTESPGPTVTVSLTGGGVLTTTHALTVTGVATLTGSGALAGLGAPGPAVASALSGSGTLGAVGSTAAAFPGTGTLAGSGTLTSVQTPGETAGATLTGSGTLGAVGSASGGDVFVAAVSLSGSGALSAEGEAIVQTPVTIAGEPFAIQVLSPTGYAGDAAVVIPDTGPDPDPTDLDPAAPSTASGMSRWMFTDPETSETYVFHINPNEMSTVHRELGLRTGTRSATVPRQALRNLGVVRVLQEKRKPLEWTFSGILRTRDQYMQLRKWSHKNRRILVTDHFDRTWSVVVSGVKYEEKRPTSQALWRFHYTVTCTLYGRVS